MMRGLVGPHSSEKSFSSTSSSPTAPTSTTLFTFGHSFTSFPYTMSVFSETLLAFLNGGDITDEDVTSVLEEYAWSSIAGGKRVREYCEDLADVVIKLNKPSAVQRLLYTGPLAALFPFIRLTTTYLPSPPPFPPPLIAPNNLPNISRKQLIDSLSKLTSSAQQSLYTEGLVFELLMEYIGRRWRAGDKDIVEHIARKLTEVEFEIQVQGDLPTMRSMVQPALQKVRFLLGFLSSTQLVLRLNALFSASLPNADRIRSDPERLIKSFIVRRLAAGNDPTLVVLDLLTSQDKINSATHRGILITSIASFGLHVETPSTTEMASGSTDTPLAPASSFGQTMPPRRATSSKIVVPFAHLASGSTDTLLAPTSPTASFGPSMSPRRATFSKIASKFSYKRKEPPTTNWLSHRKNSLSVSRLHLPDFNTDRRPSLPTLPTRSSPPFKPVKFPLAMASMTSIQTIRPIREERHEPETYGKGSDDSSAMELVHRILNLRFRVHTNGGWFLGTGRENARTLLRAAQDNTEGQHMIHDICALFGIILYPTPPPIPRPVTPASYGATGEPRTPSPNNWLPVAPCLVPLSFDYEGKHPFASTGDPISPLSIASFDLDEYYARMSSARSAKSSHGPRPSMGTMLSEDDIPNQSERDFRSTESRNRRRLSTGLESVFTSHTHLTGLTYGRTSRLSSYSIREATKEWPSTAMATTFSIPQVPTVTIGGLTVTDIDSDSNEEEPRPTHRHSRSRSETDLLAVIKRDSPLTSFPPRPTSLRRTRTINPRTSIHLSAWDLGLGHVTHLAPSSPASPFAFNMPTTNRWAQHAFSAPAMASAPPSPPLSPTSSIRVTPRVSAFPLPPKELPSPNSSRQIEVPSRVRSNRKYTIINGEVSPSRCDQGSEDYFNQQRESPNHNFPVPKPSGPSGSHPSMTGKSSQEKSLPVPPRTSSLYSRSSGETARLPSLEPETPLSLALSLFTSSQSENGSLVPRSNLTFREVDVVLHDMVECEKARIKSRGKQWDDPARCRIGWLMDQLGDMLQDPRFAPIIDVHLDRLAPTSLKTGMLNPPSPRSSPGSFQSSKHLYPSSPLTVLNGHSSLSLPISEDEAAPIPQSSPRPPPRKLVLTTTTNEMATVTSQPAYKPLTVPLSPSDKGSERPRSKTPRTRQCCTTESMDSTSTLTSKLSIGTFGH